jgi:tetratricopeptide (TPR) repeat protein
MVAALTATTLACAGTPSRVPEAKSGTEAGLSAEQLSLAGDSFASAGDMSRAEQYFVAARNAGADPARMVRRLVAVCVADSRYPVALDHAEDYLRNHPADAQVHFAVATLRAAIGDEKGARTSLARVLAWQPEFAEARYVLAQLDRASGDADAAESGFQAYLRVAPDGPHSEVARAELKGRLP